MDAPSSEHILAQVAWLLVLAIPIASVSWTMTHEELFREPRDYCRRLARRARSAIVRKFFYLFTCEYCLSHYVTIFFLVVTRYRLLLDDWRGYLVSFFALVWVANAYMNLFTRLRIDLRTERARAEKEQKIVERLEADAQRRDSDGQIDCDKRGVADEGIG